MLSFMSISSCSTEDNTEAIKRDLPIHVPNVIKPPHYCRTGEVKPLQPYQGDRVGFDHRVNKPWRSLSSPRCERVYSLLTKGVSPFPIRNHSFTYSRWRDWPNGRRQTMTGHQIPALYRDDHQIAGPTTQDRSPLRQQRLSRPTKKINPNRRSEDVTLMAKPGLWVLQSFLPPARQSLPLIQTSEED